MIDLIGNYNVVWDSEGDVLYIRLINAKVSKRIESESDSEMIIEYDCNNKIIGFIILGIIILGNKWFDNPVRKLLPNEIASIVDSYIK